MFASAALHWACVVQTSALEERNYLVVARLGVGFGSMLLKKSQKKYCGIGRASGLVSGARVMGLGGLRLFVDYANGNG